MNKNKPIFIMIAIVFSLCIICGVVALGINASQDTTARTEAKTVEQYMQEYGGNPDIYSEILSLTDCAALQDKFNTAADNLQAPGTQQRQWGMGYMDAADSRMKDIGCYK